MNGDVISAMLTLLTMGGLLLLLGKYLEGFYVPWVCRVATALRWVVGVAWTLVGFAQFAGCAATFGSAVLPMDILYPAMGRGVGGVLLMCLGVRVIRNRKRLFGGPVRDAGAMKA